MSQTSYTTISSFLTFRQQDTDSSKTPDLNSVFHEYINAPSNLLLVPKCQIFGSFGFLFIFTKLEVTYDVRTIFTDIVCFFFFRFVLSVFCLVVCVVCVFLVRYLFFLFVISIFGV